MAWTTLSRLHTAGAAERVAHGVYRLRGAPVDAQLALRAAWLQLAPAIAAWDRTPDQGVVSHRSAAALHGLGHLPADTHNFTLPVRRQSRRPDVRLHKALLSRSEWTDLGGVLVTRPARTAADLLSDGEDPGAVAQIVAGALRGATDDADAMERALGPHARAFGLVRGDGAALLEWLLDLARDQR